MSQQPLIDLLPGTIRRQCEIGVRTGRIVAAVAIGVLIVVVLATQMRWQLERERQRHAEAIELAATVHEAQRMASSLTVQLREVQKYIDAYDRVAMPLNLSAVIATIIDKLPPSVTLETLDMEAGARRVPGSSRGLTGNNTRPPRLLVVELSGFSLMNDDVSLLMMRLRNQDGFEDVTLVFNKTRVVREVMAREFRMSFRIDLDRPYEVVEASMAGASRNHELEALR